MVPYVDENEWEDWSDGSNHYEIGFKVEYIIDKSVILSDHPEFIYVEVSDLE